MVSMRKDTYYIWALLCAVVIGTTALLLFGHTTEEIDVPNEVATSTNEVVLEENSPVLPWGEVKLRVGEQAVFAGVSIRPLSIEEESRCPSDVQCIQAGTVRIQLEIVSAMGTSTDMLPLLAFITTEAQKITFTEASPYPVAGAPISVGAYVLHFEVVERTEEVSEVPPLSLPTPPVVSSGTCYVGGCSSQLCSDRSDMMSTCEYREVYACYQSAVCERQQSGECGWTETEELRSCLAEKI